MPHLDVIFVFEYAMMKFADPEPPQPLRMSGLSFPMPRCPKCRAEAPFVCHRCGLCPKCCVCWKPKTPKEEKDLSRAVEEAILEWIQKHGKEK